METKFRVMCVEKSGGPGRVVHVEACWQSRVSQLEFFGTDWTLIKAGVRLESIRKDSLGFGNG